MYRYYADYSQIRTDTGRLASSFQQVPRVVAGEINLRNAVLAPAGYSLLEADYDQLELRLIAWRAREDMLLNLYRTGTDVHGFSGQMLFQMTSAPPKGTLERQVGKTTNFSLGYQAGPGKLAEIMLLNMTSEQVRAVQDNLSVITLEDAAAVLHRRWHETFPGIRNWHRWEEREIARTGLAVAPHGRVKHLPRALSRDPKERAEALREGCNHVIQSLASDITLLAAVLLREPLAALGVQGGWPFHDSLLWLVPVDEVAQASAMIRRQMEVDVIASFAQQFDVHLDVPLVVELKTGERWGSLKSA